MSKRKTGCGCLTLIGIVIAATVGGGYLYLKGNLPWQQFKIAKAAVIIPDKAVLVAQVSTDEQMWSKLSTMGTPEARAEISRRLQSLNQEISLDGLNFSHDIQPWLGGVALAIVPDSQGQNQLLILLGIQDKLEALKFRQKLEQQSGKRFESRNYQGLKIINVQRSEGENFSFTILGNYVAIAEEGQLLETVIDTYHGETAYAQQPGFQALQGVSTLKNPVISLYIDDYTALVSPYFNFTTDQPNPTEKILGFVGAMEITPQGLHLQGVTKLANGAIAQLPTPTHRDILSQFPSETFLLIAGTNLNQSWTELVNQSQEIPILATIVAEIRNQVSQVGLKADEEVFSWLDQDFAVGFVTTDSEVKKLTMGGVVVINTTNPKTAQEAFTKVDRLLNFAGLVGVQETNLGGKMVTEWQALNLVVSRGWLDSDSLVLTAGIPFQSIANLQPKSSLLANGNFQNWTSSLPENNLGYLYVDFPLLLQEVNQITDLTGNPLSPETQTILASLEGIVAITSMSDLTATRGDVLMVLKQNP